MSKHEAEASPPGGQSDGPWRWTCPEGHRSWRSYPTNPDERQYFCEICESYFESLADARGMDSDGLRTDGADHDG